MIPQVCIIIRAERTSVVLWSAANFDLFLYTFRDRCSLYNVQECRVRSQVCDRGRKGAAMRQEDAGRVHAETAGISCSDASVNRRAGSSNIYGLDRAPRKMLLRCIRGWREARRCSTRSHGRRPTSPSTPLTSCSFRRRPPKGRSACTG